MSQLDEVSRAIGSMQSSIESLTRSHAEKAIKDEAFRQFAYQKLNGFDDMHKRLGEVESLAAGTEKTVSRVKWIASGVALAGSAIGVKVGALLTAIGVKP